jgi:hypothetical protein
VDVDRVREAGAVRAAGVGLGVVDGQEVHPGFGRQNLAMIAMATPIRPTAATR